MLHCKDMIYISLPGINIALNSFLFLPLSHSPHPFPSLTLLRRSRRLRIRFKHFAKCHFGWHKRRRAFSHFKCVDIDTSTNEEVCLMVWYFAFIWANIPSIAWLLDIMMVKFLLQYQSIVLPLNPIKSQHNAIHLLWNLHTRPILAASKRCGSILNLNNK